MTQGNNDLFDFLMSVDKDNNPFDASRDAIRETKNQNRVFDELTKAKAEIEQEMSPKEFAEMQRCMREKVAKFIADIEQAHEDAGNSDSQFMNDEHAEPSAFCNSGAISKRENEVVVRGTFEIRVATDDENCAVEHVDEFMNNIKPFDEISSALFEMTETETINKKIKSYK